MKKYILVLQMLIVLVTLVPGCSHKSANPQEVKPEAVVNDFISALSQGDGPAAIKYLADDVVLHQEPSGTEVKGKSQIEASIGQLLAWHHTYTVVGPMVTNGNIVNLIMQESADEYRIIGIEMVTVDLEITLVDGKISLWRSTISLEDWEKIAGLTAGRIGINIEPFQNGMQVTGIVSGSPADLAGLKTKDIITAVNGIDYTKMRAGEMQLRIQGPVGSKVSLTALREGYPNPILIEVTRISGEQFLK
jgi:limonene-1,2-epoxide hydrolase